MAASRLAVAVISSSLCAPVLILSPDTFSTPPLTRLSPHWQSQGRFLWHPPLPSNVPHYVCVLPILTHRANVYLFIPTGQPSPHYCQRRLTRCRPLCKYLLPLSVQYISLLFSLPLVREHVLWEWKKKRLTPGSNMLFTTWANIHHCSQGPCFTVQMMHVHCSFLNVDCI